MQRGNGSGGRNGSGLTGSRAGWGGAVALAAVLAGPAVLSEPGSGQDGERYVRAAAGAQVRNFQDAQGKVVATLEQGALLLVHGESVGFLEVSSPAGFPVWVFGEFLAETGAEGVLRATGNGVRMRPLPDSDVSSYPLTTKLSRGERVQFIERADPSLPLQQDWVKVWSPPDARGWVAAGETTPVADAAAAAAEWKRSVRELPDEPAPQAAAPAPKAAAAPAPAAAASASGAAAAGRSDEPAAPAQEVPEEAYRSLAYGDTLLENALKKGKGAVEADFDRAIKAYEVVLGMAPAASQVAVAADRQLTEARLHASMAAARAEVADVARRQEEMLDELRRENEVDALKDTAHWGRFMGRGWVERARIAQEDRWFLRWGGEIVFEVTCMSGRYDMSVFEGYEIGVKGTTLRPATAATEEAEAQVTLLDVTRVEVISGGARRR